MKKLKKRKILFVTSNRADFGLLSNLIKIVQKNKKFSSLVITLGQHLDKNYGNSINEIRNDKIKKIFKMKKKIKSSKTFHLTNYLSDVILFSNRIISKINPNLIVILGDRFEMLGPVIAGYNSNDVSPWVEFNYPGTFEITLHMQSQSGDSCNNSITKV